jgi:hypothetical protein
MPPSLFEMVSRSEAIVPPTIVAPCALRPKPLLLEGQEDCEPTRNLPAAEAIQATLYNH